MNKRSIPSFLSLILSLTFISFLLLAVPKTTQALTVTPRLDITGNPGTTAHTTLKINNEERETKTFYIRYENFTAQDETGNPTFSSRQEDLATWINTPLSITLGPGESINMPVDIAIPANADPGGHYAAIFFLTQSPAEEGGDVALGAKLGSLVLLRVNGNFVQNANILEFGTTNKKHFYTQLPIQFYYRFQNSGDDHQKPVGEIQIKNILGSGTKTLEANPVDGNVLPKSVRKYQTSWTDIGGPFKQAPVVDLPKGSTDKMSYWDAVTYQLHHFLMGRYKANLKVAFGSNGKFNSEHAEYVFWVIPWQLLSVVIPLLIVVLYILRFILRRYNRYIIKRAQRQA